MATADFPGAAGATRAAHLSARGPGAAPRPRPLVATVADLRGPDPSDRPRRPAIRVGARAQRFWIGLGNSQKGAELVNMLDIHEGNRRKILPLCRGLLPWPLHNAADVGPRLPGPSRPARQAPGGLPGQTTMPVGPPLGHRRIHQPPPTQPPRPCPHHGASLRAYLPDRLPMLAGSRPGGPRPSAESPLAEACTWTARPPPNPSASNCSRSPQSSGQAKRRTGRSSWPSGCRTTIRTRHVRENKGRGRDPGCGPNQFTRRIHFPSWPRARTPDPGARARPFGVPAATCAVRGHLGTSSPGPSPPRTATTSCLECVRPENWPAGVWAGCRPRGAPRPSPRHVRHAPSRPTAGLAHLVFPPPAGREGPPGHGQAAENKMWDYLLTSLQELRAREAPCNPKLLKPRGAKPLACPAPRPPGHGRLQSPGLHEHPWPERAAPRPRPPCSSNRNMRPNASPRPRPDSERRLSS